MTIESFRLELQHLWTAKGYVSAAKRKALLPDYDALIGSLQPQSTGNVIHVTAGTHLQSVIDAAPDGAIVSVEPGTYAGAIVLRKPLVLEAAVVREGRASATSPTVWLTSGEGTVSIVSPRVVGLLGLGITSSNPEVELVSGTGRGTVIDLCTILGGPNGQRRGIRPEGQGWTITRSHIGNIFLKGLETQAIGVSNGCRDLTIDDCTLEGAAQAFMAGGSDSTTPEMMPANIRITHSTLTKNPAWYAQEAQIKNALELKACSGFTMQDCILEYAGIAEGQGSYLIVLTPRNQYGGAPWSRVEDVLIERCVCRHAGGCVSLLGQDDQFPSGLLQRVTFRNVLFDDIDPAQMWKGDGRGFFVNNGPHDVTLEHVTVHAQHLGAAIYLGGQPPTKLTLRDVQLPQAEYGVKIDGGGMDGWPYTTLPTLQQFAPDAVIDLAGPGASGYPV